LYFSILCQLLVLQFLYISFATDDLTSDFADTEEEDNEFSICEDQVSSCADRVLAGQCHDHPELVFIINKNKQTYLIYIKYILCVFLRTFPYF